MIIVFIGNFISVNYVFAMLKNEEKSQISNFSTSTHLEHKKNIDIITITTPKTFPFEITSLPNLSVKTPSTDGADYLKKIPGFALIRNGGTNSDPIFRGMFGSRLQILTNGGEILGACAARMDTSSSYISPENYDVFKLIKGPQTVLWGPGASAGTIRFERIQPYFNKTHLIFNGSIFLSSKNHFEQKINSSFGNSFGYLRLIGNISCASNYQDGTGYSIYSKWRKWNRDLIIGITPSSNILLECTIGCGDGYAYYASRGMDGKQFKRNTINLKYEQILFDQILEKIEIQSWYHKNNHIMDNYNRQTLYISNDQKNNWKFQRNNIIRLTKGVRGISTWSYPKIEFKIGTDLQSNIHQKKNNNLLQKDANFKDIGIFTEIYWKYKPKNIFISGIRLENTKVWYYDTHITKKRKELYPALFLRLEHTHKTLPLITYAGLGLSERFPDYWELMTIKSGRGCGKDAFFRLKREKTKQLDVGAHVKFQDLDGWLSTYMGQIKDFIIFTYNSKNIKDIYANNINAYIYGGEAGLSYFFNKKWQLNYNLAWSYGKNLIERKPLPQMPPLESQFALIWKHDNWNVTGLWRLVASQHRIAINKGNIVGRDFTTSPGFGIASINIVYKVANSTKISTGIDNLFNRYYREHLNLMSINNLNNSSQRFLMEPGRSLWIRVNMFF